MITHLTIVELLRQMQLTDLERKENERSLPWKTSVQGIVCAAIPSEHWQADVLYVLFDWHIPRYRNVYATGRDKQLFGDWRSGHITGRQEYWRRVRIELAALQS